jgi:hypothetical protein
MRRRPTVAVGLAVLLLIGAAASGVLLSTRHPTDISPAVSVPSLSPPPAAVTPSPELNAEQIAALPEAKYDAVIDGLLSYDKEAPTDANTAYTLTTDTPIYAADKQSPVARFAAQNFLSNPTVVTPVETSRGWALVMTPSRNALPSTRSGDAAPQTAGWVHLSDLHKPAVLEQRVVVSVGAQTLTITGKGAPQIFTVGVGAANTPTPTGVSGYVQARYLDPAQNQTTYPIQLTSLHSSTADEPYSGHDGGLIGAHFDPNAAGDLSHGCIRLPAEAITAVNQLPLGTIFTITE